MSILENTGNSWSSDGINNNRISWLKSNFESNNFNDYTPEEVSDIDISGCVWIILFFIAIIFLICNGVKMHLLV